MNKEAGMSKYVCEVCGWGYGEVVGYSRGGVVAGTSFENLSTDFVCPLCGVREDQFTKE